jgi:branched-chain amino acid transport system substrate-binding protein
VLYQNDPFGKSGLAGAQSAMARLSIQPVALGHYERTTPEAVDEAASAVAAAQPEAVIMVAVNRASAAFARKLRLAGSAARLFSISVVNFKELLKNAGEDLVRGIGISQVMPFPYAPSTPVVREFLALMKQHAPDKTVSYASIESFVGAKVLVEALRRAGAQPTREKVLQALQELRDYDAGGFKVGFSANNRVGSRFVEVTVIGQGGRLLR